MKPSALARLHRTRLPQVHAGFCAHPISSWGSATNTVEVEYEAWIDDVPLLQIDIERPTLRRRSNLSIR